MVAAVPDSKTMYDRAAWMRGWQSPEKEIDAYTVPTQCITGQVPQDLIGTYYRNGPALFELGENQLSHPLDGRPLRFDRPPPPKYQAFLAREAARWRKFYEPPTPGTPTAEGQPPAL